MSGEPEHQEPEPDTSPPPRPGGDDLEAWRAFWRARDQPWRTEPELPEARRRELGRARGIHPDVARGIYPFAGARLSRADVEWLLATHDDGRGPVDWSDPAQRGRDGLDLRGADLHEVDLSGLPLARLHGGLPEDAWRKAPEEHLPAARLHLEQALLTGAHLEGAILESAHLEEAKLGTARLEEANLSFALLEGASLSEAHLEGASLVGASLAGANLNEAYLEGAALRHAVLSGAELFATHLEGAKLRDATLAGKRFSEELARLRRWRPDFPEALPGAFLGGAFLDPVTALDEAILGDDAGESVSLADVHWGGANLAVVDWTPVRVLGDEAEAWRAAQHYEKAKRDTARLPEVRRELLEAFRVAVRANRQLAVALRDQGLSEEADRYSYRAQKLNREVLWRQAIWGISESQGAGPQRAGHRRLRLGQRAQKLGAYLFSHFLDGLSGYGYRPGRSLAAYVLTLVLFSLAFFVLGRADGTPLSWIGAIALSINSFHGRGFFPGTVTPGDPVTIAAAVEAIAGLIIELSFIATFTQRYFGR